MGRGGRATAGAGRRGAGRATALAAVIALLPAAGMLPAEAAPARVILLRHGEKGGPYTLCRTGQERAQALVAYYLGRGAQKSLFRPGETPRAILAISMHTLDTIAPVAESWNMPVIYYSVMPQLKGRRLVLSDAQLGQRTREAARDILEKPEWAGQTLVVNWEHDHIAKTRLDAELPAGVSRGDQPAPAQRETLYDLLGLQHVAGVPYNWPRNTYDYFWIIDFDPATGRPSAVSMVKQEFGPPYSRLPANDWGKPNGLTAADGCTR